MPLISANRIEEVMSVLRSGNGIATFTDVNGFTRQAASTEAREDYTYGSLTGRYNAILNPRMIGAAVSVLPTGWSAAISTATTWTLVPNVLEAGVDVGLDYIDVNFSNPGVNTSYDLTPMVPADRPVAAQGQQFTVSMYRRRVNGATTGYSVRVGVREFSVSGTLLGQSFTDYTPDTVVLTSGRITHTHTVVDATANRVEPFISLVMTAGVAGSRVRLAAPQFEPGASATALLVPPDGTIRQEWERTGSVRRGLLLEREKTNYFVNPAMVGAATGSPGTAPTGWAVLTDGGTGIVRSIVGTGMENGIPYVDVRWSGTASGTCYPIAGMWNAGSYKMPTVAGETISASFFVRLVGGTKTGINLLRVQVGGITGATYNQYLGTDILTPLSNAALASQRYTLTSSALSVSNNNFSNTWIQAHVLDGSAVDFTLRIGAPQFEKGPVSSPILNATANTTTFPVRGRDRLTISPAQTGKPNKSALTLYAKVLLSAANQELRGIMQTSADPMTRTIIGVEPDGSVIAWKTAADYGGGNHAGFRKKLGNATYGTPMKIALSTTATTQSYSLNGSGSTDTPNVGFNANEPSFSLFADMPTQGLFPDQFSQIGITGLDGWLQEFVLANQDTPLAALNALTA